MPRLSRLTGGRALVAAALMAFGAVTVGADDNATIEGTSAIECRYLHTTGALP